MARTNVKDRVRKDIGADGRTVDDTEVDWQSIDWSIVEKRVRNLRRRIFRATKAGQWNEVRSLMKLALRSNSNLLLSVRRVTRVRQYQPRLHSQSHRKNPWQRTNQTVAESRLRRVGGKCFFMPEKKKVLQLIANIRAWLKRNRSASPENVIRYLKHLYDVAKVPITRHIKVRGDHSPDDPDLIDYWVKREECKEMECGADYRARRQPKHAAARC